MPEPMARIQARKNGRVLGFVTPGGGINRLKVHAAWFDASKANERTVELSRDNPDYSFTVQRDKQ